MTCGKLARKSTVKLANACSNHRSYRLRSNLLSCVADLLPSRASGISASQAPSGKTNYWESIPNANIMATYTEEEELFSFEGGQTVGDLSYRRK